MRKGVKYVKVMNSILLYIKNIEYFCSRKNITYEILICEQFQFKVGLSFFDKKTSN
jgi:hypothetical protein